MGNGHLDQPVKQSSPKDLGIIELEHAIGYSGEIVKAVWFHPNGNDFVYISGGCVVISSLDNPHEQSFLRGHDDEITCLCISPDGKHLATGMSFSFSYISFNRLKRR